MFPDTVRATNVCIIIIINGTNPSLSYHVIRSTALNAYPYHTTFQRQFSLELDEDRSVAPPLPPRNFRPPHITHVKEPLRLRMGTHQNNVTKIEFGYY